MLDLLREFLADVRNTDRPLKDIMAHFQEQTGATPAKSTLADWLEGGVIFFPNINQLAVDAAALSLDVAAPVQADTPPPMVHIAELSTAMWTKRGRGPNPRLKIETFEGPQVSTLVALNSEGSTIVAHTYAAPATAQEFSMFSFEAVSVVAQQAGIASTDVIIGTSQRYMRPEHGEVLGIFGCKIVPADDAIAITMNMYKQAIVEATKDCMTLMPDILRVAVTTAVSQYVA